MAKDLPPPQDFTDEQATRMMIQFCIHAGISPLQTIRVCQTLIAAAMNNTEGFDTPETEGTTT